MRAHVDVEALCEALDRKRRSQGLSWRQVAGQAGVSASTLTRMTQGKRPDVDGFAALIDWLGVPPQSFMRGMRRRPVVEDPLTVIAETLKASEKLSPKDARALTEIVRIAYDALTSKR
jgi:transcriptional regulator with XRE-family HTH domain